MAESYEEYKVRRDAANRAKMTDPPTAVFDDEWDGEKEKYLVEYPNNTHVKYVCRCGSQTFEVFYIEGAYTTYVICPSCKRRGDVHTG